SRAPEVQRVGGARTVAERDDQLAGFAHLVPPSHHRAALGVRMALEIDTLQAALAACRDTGCCVGAAHLGRLGSPPDEASSSAEFSGRLGHEQTRKRGMT